MWDQKIEVHDFIDFVLPILKAHFPASKHQLFPVYRRRIKETLYDEKPRRHQLSTKYS
jgi:hypothetical protein